MASILVDICIRFDEMFLNFNGATEVNVVMPSLIQGMVPGEHEIVSEIYCCSGCCETN